MLLTSICKMSMTHFVYLYGTDLSVSTWKRQYFMSGCFNCSGLMHINVSAYCCNCTLIRTECRTDHSCIGLCSAYQEMHICILTFTQILNLLSCTVAVWIQSISVGLFHICLYRPLHNCRMGTFCPSSASTLFSRQMFSVCSAGMSRSNSVSSEMNVSSVSRMNRKLDR